MLIIDEEYAQLLDEPRLNAELDREMRAMDREIEREMEQMYREFPDLRPTPAELEVERLRDRANGIEYAEFGREMEEYRIARMNELRRIRPLIDGKID